MRELEFVYLVMGAPKPKGGALVDSEYVEQVYSTEHGAEREACQLNRGPSGKNWRFYVAKHVIEDAGGALDPAPR